MFSSKPTHLCILEVSTKIIYCSGKNMFHAFGRLDRSIMQANKKKLHVHVYVSYMLVMSVFSSGLISVFTRLCKEILTFTVIRSTSFFENMGLPRLKYYTMNWCYLSLVSDPNLVSRPIFAFLVSSRT